MSKRTPIYNFLYLELGDVIYPGLDQDNMQTAENQIYGMYDYLGQGIISGWTIHWMGCTSDAYVMQQRQDLINAYRADRFSYLGLQYQSLNYPVTEDDWNQCVVVSQGLGIVGVFHAATEYPSFFRFTSADHFYIWAEKNVCTNTEYLCSIVAPEYPDEDYDLSNQAIYVGEVFTGTVSSKVTVTQILYSDRRRDLKNAQGDVQRLLTQALVAHVHSGEGSNPSKINLSTNVTITVSIVEFSNVFTFTYPSGFNALNYSTPQVYLNSNLLLPNQYKISGNTIFLQNSVPVSSSLQIVYELAPGPQIYITSSLTPPLQARTLTFPNEQIPFYYLTDGSVKTLDDETQEFNVWAWNDQNYSAIQLYIDNQLIDPEAYSLYQINQSDKNGGRLKFIGPILPSITNYNELQVVIKFVTPSFQVSGLLPSDKIKSINAASFTRGTLSQSRLSGLDHLGLLRIDEPAVSIPHKKLLDSGDHIRFYPEISSLIQYSDYIIYSNITANIKLQSSDSTTVPRALISTPNGLYATKNSSLDFINIVQLPWNTDNGVADEFAENYFGNYSEYSITGINPQTVNPKQFWILSKSKNQFVNVLYLSTDFGITYKKINLPRNTSNEIVTINDFIYSMDVFKVDVGQVIVTYRLEANSVYYMATTDGLYTATLTRSQNKTKPIWQSPSKNTTNVATGSINKISEIVYVGYTKTVFTGGTTSLDFNNYKNLYAACDNGFFVFLGPNGIKFTTNSTVYNVDSSAFSFVYWLGVNDSSNNMAGIIWADNYGVYYSNSGQKQVTTSTGNNSTTTTVVYTLPLQMSRTNLITVDCATTENLVLTEAVSTIDGYSLSNADIVLVKNQTDKTQNGIYLWSSVTQTLFPQTFTASKIYVTNGTQAETEWIELNTDQNNPDIHTYAPWFINLWNAFGITFEADDFITSVVLDKSSGPGSLTTDTSYQNSFFVSSTKYIYRVLCFVDPAVFPQVIQINWDYENNGLITSIQHFASTDNENGLLVVLTENGIFQSTADAFTYGPLNGLGDLILPNDTYVRFTNAFDAAQAANATVYNGVDLDEYSGKIISIGLTTNTTSIANGIYKNQLVNASGTNGSGLSVDFTVNSGVISNLEINNPGKNYESDIDQLFVNVYGQGLVYLQSAITQGTFEANEASQYFLYSKSDGINPNNLLYEVEYTNFYTKPWSNFPLVTAKINNVITDRTFGYNGEFGLIQFAETLPKELKDSVTISLTNIGQYISNTGTTPHGEVFNVVVTDLSPAAGISTTYDPVTATSNLLPLKLVDNTKWNPSVNTIKVVGTRSTTSSTTPQQYAEVIQVGVSTANGLSVFIKSKPTTLPLTLDSKVYVARNYDRLEGIEDKLTLAKSKLTYHMDSVSHLNVYNLSNALVINNPVLYNFPAYQNETLIGVDRGLKNTLYVSSLENFDPEATFVGFTFGVDPSSSDIAAAPSFINLILNFEYGNNPTFATDKGLWQYVRSSDSWIRVDTLNNSELVYFANKTLTDSLNVTNVYAGTNQGLFYQYNGQYTLNTLFEEPQLSINMGEWYTSSTTSSRRYEAYGKDNSLSFVLRTTQNATGAVTFASDYFDGYVISDIYYNTFYRYNDKGERTEHPAIYLATDYSVWAFTTDPAPNSPGPGARGANHTLLVGREMFGNFILRNINRTNPSALGTPVKVNKIVPIPSGGRSTWLAFATSNGVYVVINWKQCDVGDPNGLSFYPQNVNSNNQTIGRQCFAIVNKTNDSTNSIYFCATDMGVYKSTSRCTDWAPTSKFDGQELSVNDLKYFTDTSGNGYLVATTNIGLWITDDDGDSWSTIESYSDPNIQILSTPTYGAPFSDNPKQYFSSISTGKISKAFMYINPMNLTGITSVYAKISNGVSTYLSSSFVELTSRSYPGMYGFAFTNAQYPANTTYYLAPQTLSSVYDSELTWGISNLDNPFANGYAQTNSAISGANLGLDFFFKINLNTPATPTETIEPVGFYNTSYAVGFAQGNWSGAAISTTGSLYSNIGILCNTVIDISKSFEINDTAIITLSGVSTNYLRNAIVNTLVPNGSDTNTLYNRLQNGMGTSKFLTSIYGFNNNINDLLFFSTADASTSNCLTSSSQVYQGYTNNSTAIQNSVNYVSNTGRLSKLYDAVLYNSRLQFPAVIAGYYSSNLDEVDTNFINVQAVKESYKQSFSTYLQLNLVNISGSTYGIYYQDDSNNFVWLPGTYEYSLTLFDNNTADDSSFVFDPLTGIGTNYSAAAPETLLLSKNWAFDSSIQDLSSAFTALTESSDATEIALNQYAKGFKPLIIVGTDGNDDSSATPIGVNSSLKVAWTGTGTQVLVVEPNESGNQEELRTMIQDTNSKILKYNNDPETLLKNALFEDDSLDLFSSVWTRNYDFESFNFISYIYAKFVIPSGTTVKVEFKWTKDRINFSNFIEVNSGEPYNLNQKVLSIYYRVTMTESYANGQRVLPYVQQLYHVVVTPSIQTYLTYPQEIDGQLFETLASGSFTNNSLVTITPIVGRTESTDTAYFEQVQLNRNGVLPNRQLSYRITPPRTVTGLKLLPLKNEESNLGYYITDTSGNIYTWTVNDTFSLFANGAQLPPSPPANAYTTVPESGIVYVSSNIYVQVNNQFLYESFTATIAYAEQKESIIGEPTITYDYRTYYFSNGRIPTDANVVVLVNQEIYKGNYVISAYDGTVTFAKTLDAFDYVTIFVKFANSFRAGLQVESYSQGNLSLQTFNFTYTSIPNLQTYNDSFNYSTPILIGSPSLEPYFPNRDSELSLSYNYFDDSNVPESGTQITWWRQRTGIEYVVYDPSVSLNVSGASFSGLGTAKVTSYYNRDEYPFSLSVTLNSNGITTQIVNVAIEDRGKNFIGTSTSFVSPVYIQSTGTAINNLGSAMTAYTLSTSAILGYATTDYFVRINPNSPIGYSSTFYGFANTPDIVDFPNYDNRSFERPVDIGNRALFDARDVVYTIVTPSNGVNSGGAYQSNPITISANFTPTVSSLSVAGLIASFNGLNTTLTVPVTSNQIPTYNFIYPISPYTERSSINWFKLSTKGPVLLSSVASLSSSLINPADQIYYNLYPGVVNADGTIGYGNTTSSDVYTVVS